jgi:hypothetical protein
MDPSLAAGRIHRDNVAVMHVGCRTRFVLEALQLLGIERGSERQNLQRYPANEGNLFCLVNDSHPPLADLTENVKVAQASGYDSCRTASFVGRQRRRPHHLQRWQQFAEQLPYGRVADSVFFRVRLVAPADAAHELINHLGQQGFDLRRGNGRQDGAG